MDAMDQEEKNMDSGRPGVRNKEELGSGKKEKRERCREGGREGGIKAFSHVSIHSVHLLPPTSPPERWNDEARERSSK